MDDHNDGPLVILATFDNVTDNQRQSAMKMRPLSGPEPPSCSEKPHHSCCSPEKSLAETPSLPAAHGHPGQGGYRVGAGKALYRTEPAFRPVLDQCGRLLREERDTSLLDIMFGREDCEVPSDRAWEPPTTYALETAFTALWESIG